MSKQLRVAMIGLDTSHTIEFARRMQGSDCPAGQAVAGLRAVTCLRFRTPFIDDKALDERQRTLEAWGVKVTDSFDEAVADCDGLMLEINDPALHLEYFTRCAALNKPIFLDKPLADTIRNGLAIAELATAKGVRLFSSSALRYDPALTVANAAMVWGPLGVAPAGSSIVWYGVHAFEMLQRCMGRGAALLRCQRDLHGVVAHVDYADGRRGLVELTRDAWRYGGVLRDHRNPEVFFAVAPGAAFYGELMRQVAAFFQSGESPLPLNHTVEVMAMLDAAERSAMSGQAETIYAR